MKTNGHRSLPVMTSFEDAVSLCDNERDNFYTDAFMLQACKGAYLWLGQAGAGERVPLHNPRYDFNDDVLGTGIALHVALAERLLSA